MSKNKRIKPDFIIQEHCSYCDGTGVMKKHYYIPRNNEILCCKHLTYSTQMGIFDCDLYGFEVGYNMKECPCDDYEIGLRKEWVAYV